MTSIRTAIRHLDTLALLALVAGGVTVANLPPTLDDLVGACTTEVAQIVGSPCWAPEVPVVDPTDALADAATIATLTDGMTCDEPATLHAAGTIPTAVVVQSVTTGTICSGTLTALPTTRTTPVTAVVGTYTPTDPSVWRKLGRTV